MTGRHDQERIQQRRENILALLNIENSLLAAAPPFSGTAATAPPSASTSATPPSPPPLPFKPPLKKSTGEYEGSIDAPNDNIANQSVTPHATTVEREGYYYTQQSGGNDEGVTASNAQKGPADDRADRNDGKKKRARPLKSKASYHEMYTLYYEDSEGQNSPPASATTTHSPSSLLQHYLAVRDVKSGYLPIPDIHRETTATATTATATATAPTPGQHGSPLSKSLAQVVERTAIGNVVDDEEADDFDNSDEEDLKRDWNERFQSAIKALR